MSLDLHLVFLDQLKHQFLFKLCYEITQDLSKNDIEINEERKNVLLIDSGIKK